jgi:DNA mismatch endonuclease (patch repair protein)
MTDPPPVASSPGVSSRMQCQRRAGTMPEAALRRALHARSHRYRVGLPVPGRSRRTIDIAFTRSKVAVFVDGCFWHRCPEHATTPKANGTWWAVKLAKNVARDLDTDEHLRAAGWTVVRIWEHEPLDRAVERVETALADAGASPQK